MLYINQAKQIPVLLSHGKIFRRKKYLREPLKTLQFSDFIAKKHVNTLHDFQKTRFLETPLNFFLIFIRKNPGNRQPDQRAKK